MSKQKTCARCKEQWPAESHAKMPQISASINGEEKCVFRVYGSCSLMYAQAKSLTGLHRKITQELRNLRTKWMVRHEEIYAN